MSRLITPIVIPATTDTAPYTVSVAECEIDAWITATIGTNPTHHSNGALITVLVPAPRPAVHVNFLAFDLINSLGTVLDHLPQGTALVLGEEDNAWATPPPLAHSMINSLQASPHDTNHPGH